MERNLLRIEIDQDTSARADEPVVLLLNGHLVASTLPSLVELVSIAHAEGSKIELDLDRVTRADENAAEYLVGISKNGVRLRRCSLAVQVWMNIVDRGATHRDETP